MSDALTLPNGLSGAGTADFATLIEEISAQPMFAALPWLAPVLLFSDPSVRTRLAMPEISESEFLVHDYQSVDYITPLPTDSELQAQAEVAENGGTTELVCHFSHADAPCATIRTALRRVPKQDLSVVKPVGLGTAQTAGPAGLATGLVVSQAQIDAYVALSGDTNPIHSDPAAATALGLPAPIVPGVLLVATVQPLASIAASGPLTSLRCRFMAPLCVDQPYAIALIARGPTRLRACFLGENAAALAIADLQFSA